MNASRPHDPGLLGYAAAVVIAYAANGVLVGLRVAADDPVAGLGLATVGLPFTMMYEATYGLPFALVGVALLHLICQHLPEQWVHVTVAGMLGAATGAFLSGTILEGHLVGWNAAQVALATAVGRAAVIPLVVRRRAAVERDFRPTA